MKNITISWEENCQTVKTIVEVANHVSFKSIAKIFDKDGTPERVNANNEGVTTYECKTKAGVIWVGFENNLVFENRYEIQTPHCIGISVGHSAETAIKRFTGRDHKVVSGDDFNILVQVEGIEKPVKATKISNWTINELTPTLRV